MQITDSVNTIKGIGPKKAAALERLGIRTIEDFLFFFPRDYQDRRNRTAICDLREDETVLIAGKVLLLVPKGFGRKRTLQLLVGDETGEINIVFFNAIYLEKTIRCGQEYEFYGKVTARTGRLQMAHPEMTPLTGDEKREGILPVYPLTEGLRQAELQKWETEAMLCLPMLSDYLPTALLERNRLCNIEYAIRNIHFPEDPRKVKEAKYRLIFEEFLFLQLGLMQLKRRFDGEQKGIRFSDQVKMAAFVDTLPFPLTNAQKRVLAEVEADMESDGVMNRLIQGDVGSGKTVIAAAAAYKAVKSGSQAAIMAPTELLATQHLKTFRDLFTPLGIRVDCLTGNSSQKERKKLLQDLKAGEIDFLIGTHALLQPEVEFCRLGLAITDEQHRFGVRQRGLLTQKGSRPDVLVMTATPIPRSLAVILYGDLDLSAVDELPPGRKQIVTKAVTPGKRNDVYEFISEEIGKGRQAYIVAPLIEESTEIDAKSAVRLFEEVSAHFRDSRVSLLHGAMKQTDKEEIMAEFAQGKTDILVSTVVIEVGINIPNASIMMIENAERFGLAALHQLRGRVGRGAEQSYCFLVNEGKTEISRERIKTLCETNDGFLIAEKDLKLRGPGDFFGTRQHGLPELKLADPVRHLSVLEKARTEALNLLADDPSLSRKENREIRGRIAMLFGELEGFSI